MKNLLPVALLCTLMSTIVDAQRGPELGLAVGVSNYFGDLNTSYSLKRVGPAVALVGRHNFNNRMSIKFAGTYGRLQARDSDSENPFQRARNLSFRSPVIDGSLQIEFNFFPYIHGSPDHFFTPYVLLGAGFSYTNPKAFIDDRWVALQPLGTEGQPVGGEYSLGQPAIAFGFGIKTDLTYQWSLNVELSGRALFTDYIDDVSTTYPNLLQLQNIRGSLAARLSDRSGEVSPEPISEPGRQRGNSRNSDAYAFLTVGIMHYFGKVPCPAISRPHTKRK